MKIFRRTFFRLFFLVVVLTCLGIDTYSTSGFQAYSIAFSGEHHKPGNSIANDNDAGNHDQIPYKYKFSVVEEPAFLMPVFQHPSLVSGFSAFIWQPPKM